MSSSSLPSRDRPAPLGAGRFVVWAAAALALAPARAAAAQERALGSVEVEVEAEVAYDHLDYAESSSTGQLLDRETGFVPSVGVAVALERSRWFARLDTRWSTAKLDYAGLTQSGDASLDGLPVASTTNGRFVDVELQAGAWVEQRRRFAVYGGGAWRGWDRDIASTSVVPATGSPTPVQGLHERYSWLELQAGARAILVRTSAAEVLLDARVLQLVAGRVRLDWSGTPVTLGLGPRPGARLALAVRFPLSARWAVGLEGHWSGWSFGASAVDRATGLQEPESATTRSGVEARLAASY